MQLCIVSIHWSHLYAWQVVDKQYKQWTGLGALVSSSCVLFVYHLSGIQIQEHKLHIIMA